MCAQPSPGDHVEKDERKNEKTQHRTQYACIAWDTTGTTAHKRGRFSNRSQQHHFLKISDFAQHFVCFVSFLWIERTC